MKAKLSLAIIATTALLTACGGSHEKVHAVDKVEEAQKQALEKAPKAEEIKFDDHGETPMGGVGGANNLQPSTNNAQEVAIAEAQNTAGTPSEVAEVATDAPVAEEPAKAEEAPAQ